MKRIMFYKKRPFPRKSGFTPITDLHAVLYLMFTFYLCGCILGCALFRTEGFAHDLSMAAADNFRSQTAVWTLANAGIRIITILLLFVFCSFSCFGSVWLCLIAGCTGSRFGMLASALLTAYGWKGFWVFAVLSLPGGILLSIAELSLFSFGAAVSKNTAACIFRAGDVQIHIRDYIRQTIVPTVLLLASAASDFFLRLSFAGILDSGI